MEIVRNLRSLIVAATVVAALVSPAVAEGRNMLSARDVNMRSGPGVGFRHVATVMGGQIVTVYGCARDNSWCDIDWAGNRGWVSAKFLRLPGMTGGIAKLAQDLGVPAIEYDADEYEARHYAVTVEPAGTQLIRTSLADNAGFAEAAGNQDLLGGNGPK